MRSSAAVADLEVEAGARLDAAAGISDTCPDQTVHETTNACSRTVLGSPEPNLSHSFQVNAEPDPPGVILPNSFFRSTLLQGELQQHTALALTTQVARKR